MPGTLTIRPLTANLTRDTEIFGTMDPYCKIILGNQKISGEVCRNGGKHPSWEDTLVLRRISEPSCVIEVKEKDWLLPDGTIGICDVNLLEVEAQKRVLKWYPVLYENKPVGKLLLEISYEPDHKEIIRDALPKNTVLNERVNQGNPQEQQPKKGFLEGIVLGWNPFGSKAQQQPVEIPKQEIQAPPVQQIQNLNQPQNVYQAQNYDQNTYLQQSQVYSGNNWAPPSQEENNYPQKYPQFSPQQSMNIDSGYRGAYYPNPNVGYVQPVSGDHPNENREVYDYRENQGQGAEAYGSGHYLNEYYGNYNPQQESQGQAGNKVDPLRVIRGL